MEQPDKILMLALNFDGGQVMDGIMWIASRKLTWIPLYLLILYVIYRRCGWKYMLLTLLFVAAGVGLSDQICNFFKYNHPPLRPTHTPGMESLLHTVRDYRGGLYGTVSAHAATTFCVFLLTSLTVKKRWYTVPMLLWTVLVCYSRIYLGVHWPLDIFFGLVTGAAVALLLWRLMLWTAKRMNLTCAAG